MSLKSRRFSLDSFYPDRNGRKKSIRSQSLDVAEEETQKLHHGLNSKISLRDQTIAEKSLNKSDGLINSDSFLKHNKIFHKLFEEIPEGESLTNSFTCALQKEVLYHGKLFVSENHVCFHSSVLLKDTKLVIPVSSVSKVKKHNSALSMLSIQTSSGQKYSLVSMRNRDKCYELLESVCSHAQEGSANSSPHLSSGENETHSERLSSLSSLEDSVDLDLTSSYLDNTFPQMSSEGGGPSRCCSTCQNSLIEEDHIDEPRIYRATEKVAPPSLFRKMKNFGALFYIYMIMLLLLLLASGYIGLRITALEEQLNFLGALSDLSSHYREYQER
ncbi:GRAM domain-containing protein 2B-like isoform X2 [Melanotaenia boesemani]|uniref:GRAM domain-containing protein 2B-like isoform X2 n=1 Tax=Melanotaenia boesemani TaxID=1250792 RepID=UPI001C054F3E|nr:GRAM domain-containing protein 2B-like isoform X2 [Melanotaenia boesemani]